MHPQLADLSTQLNAVTARALDMARPRDDAAFHKRPPSGGWSAAECMAHLNLTTVEFLPRLDKLFATARLGFADTQRYRRGLIGAMLAWSLEPPARMRFRTAPRFVPNSTGRKEEILAEWERLQRELDAQLRRASGLHLNELRVRSPFNSRVTYNVYAAFCILAAHERRHVWQAERALAGA